MVRKDWDPNSSGYHDSVAERCSELTTEVKTLKREFVELREVIFDLLDIALGYSPDSDLPRFENRIDYVHSRAYIRGMHHALMERCGKEDGTRWFRGKQAERAATKRPDSAQALFARKSVVGEAPIPPFRDWQRKTDHGVEGMRDGVEDLRDGVGDMCLM